MGGPKVDTGRKGGSGQRGKGTGVREVGRGGGGGGGGIRMEKRRHTLKVRENFSRAARSVPVYTSRKLSGRANTSLIGENCNRLAEKTVSTRASYSVACSLSQRHPPRQTASRPQNKTPTPPGYPHPPTPPTPSLPNPLFPSTCPPFS